METECKSIESLEGDVVRMLRPPEIQHIRSPMSADQITSFLSLSSDGHDGDANGQLADASPHPSGTALSASSPPICEALPCVSAALSQVPLIPGDETHNEKVFPPGEFDENDQQIDLRGRNSWTLQMDEVYSVELAEVHVINALAPYIISR